MSDTELKTEGGKIRLYVGSDLSEGARVTATSDQSHYLVRVMRGGVGDRVALFNGRDGEWIARIGEVGRRDCTFVCERRVAAQTDVPDIWLVFAPIKKTPADYVVQKATELGVRALQPVITRRTIVSRVNLARMQANAIEAAEQSGRLSVPDVREPLALDRLLAHWPAGRRLYFCDEAGDALPIARALAQDADGPAAILSGPEGGFDPAEREAIRARAFTVPVSLGERILRADTAALAALAVWQSVKGDWR